MIETHSVRDRKIGITEENPYWEGYLSGSGASEILGYDYATETADCIFHNLEIFEDILEAAGLRLEDIDKDKVFDPEAITEMSEEELAKLSPATKVAMAFRQIISTWMWMEREYRVVKIIEHMDKDEYEKARQFANAGFQNVVLRYNCALYGDYEDYFADDEQ